MRIGYTDMAILILGMFSRWINNLEEEDFKNKKVMINLNAIRKHLLLFPILSSLSSQAST